MKLILASASEGRKKLLEFLKVPFEIIPSFVKERDISYPTPLETLKQRAKAKGENVASYINDLSLKRSVSSDKSRDLQRRDFYFPFIPKEKSFFILSADSGIILNGLLIGKPRSYRKGMITLAMLSDKTHDFITAFYCIKMANNSIEKIWEDYEKTRVTFRKISKKEIEEYLSRTNFSSYAGGYAIVSAQDFITKIDGSVSNVIGLPLEKIIPILRKNRLLNVTL